MPGTEPIGEQPPCKPSYCVEPGIKEESGQALKRRCQALKRRLKRKPALKRKQRKLKSKRTWSEWYE